MSNPVDTLEEIHNQVLSGFRFMDDIDQFGQEEHWQFPVDVSNVTGDCDDFAIACRLLVKRGLDYPSRLVVCTTEENDYHLVCAVGQWILDNRMDSVVSKEYLERRGYEFLYTSGSMAGDPWYKLV